MRFSRVKLRGRILPAHFFCSIVSVAAFSSWPRPATFGRRSRRPGVATHRGTLSGSDSNTSGQASAPRLSWRDAIEQTVTGLGFEPVDVERSARGLLRVFIDRIPGKLYPSGEGEFIAVEDCEQVTRQLQYVLEVENVAYERLEVSSPGLDRPLKREADYARFTGHEISLTLKLPFQGRKIWKGLLGRSDAGWNLVFNDGKAEQVLDFGLDEVREARLVPVVDFKGRRPRQGTADTTGVDGGLVR